MSPYDRDYPPRMKRPLVLPLRAGRRSLRTIGAASRMLRDRSWGLRHVWGLWGWW